MKVNMVLNQRLLYVAAAFVLVLSLLLSSLTMAAQVTNRSVELSSSSAASTGVTYQVNFTTVGAAEAVVIDFCSNSPLIGQVCTAPEGFSLASATVSTGEVESRTANRLVIEAALTAATATTIELGNVTNPSDAGAIYARIVTYDTVAAADASSPTALGSGVVDQGGVALSITPTIGVTGTVLETLTFCVSGTAIEGSCASTTAPNVRLGENVGDVFAMAPGTLYEDSIHTQLSTNAANGVVVHLKSSAVGCGGLIYSSDPGECHIAPALNTGIDPAANLAKFGVKTATATNTDETNWSGNLIPSVGSYYNNDTYAMNFVTGDATGVTSTFGDPFLETEGEPVNGKNMVITFGAAVGNSTPAGTYSADLSLIAVGRF